MEPSKSNNTETEEETIAFNRKRARRVSFADNEITSVHIFRPDDDHSSSSSEIPAETLDIFRQLVAESDDEEPDRRRNSTDGEGEAVDHRNSFLQPIGSPSPGGSSINADDDTDDDEFGGPVSMDFIKPGRLSDSGVSDDITMDSTAFSMHYRSLARSDSGDLKTPTRFEATVSTPGLSSATPGSFMELTDREKRVPQSPVVASASEDSDAMSIEGEQPKTYDYVRLSPGLVAILAQGSKDLDGVSPLGSKATHPPIAVAFGSSTKNTKEFVNDETLLACKQLNSAKANRATPPNMDEGDKLATHSPIANHMEVLPNMESLVNSPVHQITHDTTVASALESSIKNTKEFVNDATPFACNQLDSAKANRGTPPKMDEADKLDLAAKYELGFCEVPVNESNSKDRGQVTDSNNKSDQVTGNHPVHEFTPLSCSANKLAFMVSPDSFRRTGNITRPLNLKQSGMLGPEVHAANSATLLSIRKNISKLKNLPNTSTLKEKNDKLKRRFSKYSPGTSFFPERDFENKQVETLTAPLEEQPFSLTLENNMHQSLINTGDHVVDSLINTSKLSQNEETVATEKDEEKICLISAKVSYNDKNLAPMDIGASPTLKTHITRVEDSTVEKRKDEILTNTHAKPFSSPVKSFDHTLLPSVECQSNFHGELKQMEMQNESVNSGLEQAIEYDKLTVARKLDLSGVGNSKQPSSPFEDAQFSKFIKSALKGKPARSPPNRFPDLSSPIQEATTALPSLQEPPSDIQDLSPRINSDGHGVDLDNNHHLTFQVAQSPLKTGIEVSSGEKRNDVDLDNNCHPALQVSHSPFTKTGIEVSSEKKRKGVELLSDIRALSHRINSDGHGVDLDNNCHPTLQVAQSPLTKTGIEVSSGKKRKGVQLLSNGDDIEKTGRIDRSQEVHKSGDGDLQFVLEQTSMRSEREKFGDQKWNDFDHVLERFSTSTKQLLSPSFDKLNFRLMGTLEDILVRLQKVKKWDILSSEIHSQKKLTDPLDIPRHKRVVEMKLLLFNIAYEKAKLQLMNVKRERLLEKVQQLSSGLQETQMMKNSMPCSAKTRLVDIQADDSHINTKIFNSQGKCQVSCKNVMETRQELENLDQKAKSLSEFFYSYCKMKGDQSYTNVVRSVRDYLEKRISYKLVFQNLKLWDVEDFERKDDYHMIILNYRGYFIQRFTVNAGLSSIIVSNSLNDVNIGKTYPNMDAFSAFVFALNPHTTSKCMGRISMAQETQITGSLLSNLLDVVEEVQLARVEIRNLVQAKFNSHSVNQLDLQLSFIDFCGGKKVQVILDMTCLKCGAYPAEVLPSQIYGLAANGEQKALPSSLVDEIRSAAESVSVGYSRIVRLCRCISQAVQGCTQGR
ncbi:uncharacterized protein LOC123905660 isoform X6 [Trifolium pratense]|uniref:uncharacterized protein LOC123905660 isoform X6 n=1 Tax=Trifolium pratense TaxID=57577 RepID=UPI001E697411|nr:uncharacterized protein LOC123905660 isoform X6 [Trifolium pratense]